MVFLSMFFLDKYCFVNSMVVKIKSELKRILAEGKKHPLRIIYEIWQLWQVRRTDKLG